MKAIEKSCGIVYDAEQGASNFLVFGCNPYLCTFK